ncbi:hypothetical protein SAMD00019534_004910 [Acytostelium subglobosum LB1]|uniref:hypothetical protein n=1 Tax=Acytostelium subglobosum LB1 TaxID=1410327 RepID=UPI000644A03B|nr:hypothetical protein SAMD00019534_004910 [Acytostelium subglobosum LB1]GAM17316.1 hypothetical protein SAMD00019534_004910 [Acytostelium subglobosum LB1]|eukprot:XP_012759378.1 hypothetical protein SAMD00019534_004910 [Acytostelium subglobosum LB1]
MSTSTPTPTSSGDVFSLDTESQSPTSNSQAPTQTQSQTQSQTQTQSPTQTQTQTLTSSNDATSTTQVLSTSTSSTSSINQQQQEKKLSFSQDMWDGFDLLCRRTEFGLDQCRELLDFFKKRAALEEKYAKSVVEPFSKFKFKDDTDSFQKGFLCMSMFSESESNIHKSFAQNLMSNLCHPFTAMVKEMEIRRKNMVSEGLRLRSDYKDSLEAVRRVYQKYEKASKETESAKIELINVLEKEPDNSQKIQSIDSKVARCEALSISAEEEYKDQIKETNNFIHGYYQSKMEDNLNEFQQFESMRIQFIKSNIKNYFGLMLEIPPTLEGELNNGCKQTDWIDPETDIQTFIQTHTTLRKIHPPLQFEPYIEGKLISLNNSASSVHLTASSPPPRKLSFKENIFGFFNVLKKEDVCTITITSFGQYTDTPTLATPIQSVHVGRPIFGTDLDELMRQQKNEFPQVDVPLILINFVQTLLKLNALETEGIFRMSPSHTQIQQEKLRLDEGGTLDHLTDVHLVASLLKNWLRDLPTPIISADIYDELLTSPINSWAIMEARLPELNIKVLRYLIDFLVEFSEPEYAIASKMDCHSLAVVLAPVLIRSPINDPQRALENSKKEVKIIECMIVEALATKKEKELLHAERTRNRNNTPLHFDESSITGVDDLKQDQEVDHDELDQDELKEFIQVPE